MAAQRQMYPLSADNGICSSYVGGVQVYQAYLGSYRNLDGATGLAPGRVEPNQHGLSMVMMITATPNIPRKGLRSLVLLIMWEVWKEHNARVFNRHETAATSLMAKISEEASTWIVAGARDLSLSLARE
jgi:hypothetical protein